MGVTNSREIEARGAKLSQEPVAVEAMYYDEMGNPMRTYTHEGKVHIANEQGRFRVLDSSRLELEARYEEERESYVDDLVAKFLISDSMSRRVAGIRNVRLYDALFGGPAGGGKYAQLPDAFRKHIPESLWEYDCRVDTMRCTAPKSEKASWQKTKLRRIVTVLNPILDRSGETEKHQLDAHAEPLDPQDD